MSKYKKQLEEDARLVILRTLAEENAHTLNETILTSVLETFGINRSRDWVKTQLNTMAELGAISVQPAGSVLVATLTRAGLDHIKLKTIISGISKPSPEE